jgi:hypothetical protein
MAEVLREMPGVKSVGLGADSIQVEIADGSPLAPLVTRLVHDGAQIEEIRKGASSLEEAFLTLLREPK